MVSELISAEYVNKLLYLRFSVFSTAVLTEDTVNEQTNIANS